jgi:hypothetical protein
MSRLRSPALTAVPDAADERGLPSRYAAGQEPLPQGNPKCDFSDWL